MSEGKQVPIYFALAKAMAVLWLGKERLSAMMAGAAQSPLIMQLRWVCAVVAEGSCLLIPVFAFQAVKGTERSTGIRSSNFQSHACGPDQKF